MTSKNIDNRYDSHCKQYTTTVQLSTNRTMTLEDLKSKNR